MDTLSDVLRNVRLTGAVYFTVDASEPWVAESAPGPAIAPHIASGVEHVVNYHIITRGSCWSGIIGQAPVMLEAGDVIVFPHGDAHVVSSAPGMRGRPDPELYRQARHAPLPVCLSLQGGGPVSAQMICGFLGCDARPFNPLLAALPRVIHLRGAGQEDASLRRLVQMALVESESPSAGSASVLARVSELLFVEAIRQYVAKLPAEQLGWFAGMRDESVGKVLQRLHHRPAYAWTLEELARETALSRTVLMERFTQVVGVPPMQYLARWRVQIASSMLRSSNASLAEIATRVGYGSEGALSRAFKRWVGVAPALYRRSPQAVGA